MTKRTKPDANGHKDVKRALNDAPKLRYTRILSPSGMSGVALGTVAGAALAGPVGAVVGAALGGAAGEALERASSSESSERTSEA